MILGNYAFEEPIRFTDDTINVLVVENPKLMTKLIGDLKHQSEGSSGSFVLMENGMELPMSSVMMIHDPLFFEINSRKIINRLNDSLEKEAVGPELYMDTNDLLSRIESHICKMADTQPYALVWNEVNSISRLIKMVDFGFPEDHDLPGKIHDAMLLNGDYLKIVLFVFVNLKSYLMPEDLQILYEEAKYHKHNILLIESHIGDKLPNECVRVIDFDLCEFET